MKISSKISKEDQNVGQGLVEYALILVLVAIIVIIAVTALGGRLGDVFGDISGELGENGERSVADIKEDFSSRIQTFYEENGRWPKSWGDERFIELDLDPADWEEPVSGVLWIPHGDNIGLGNLSGDNIRLYVNKMDGSKMEIYTVVWCYPTTNRCYYRFPSPENEVNISTLEVIFTD